MMFLTENIRRIKRAGMEVMMGKEMVLLYGLENKKGEEIRRICLQLGIRIKHVRKEQLHLPVGMLSVIRDTSGVKAASSSVDSEVPEEMMVMSGLSSAAVDRFLARMKKAGIGIDLKAVVTEYNKNWSSVQLYQELKAEHDKFTKKK